MRIEYILSWAVILMILSAGCGGTKKVTKVTIESDKSKVVVNNTPKEESKQEEKSENDTITVKEEKLVGTQEAPVPKEKYFVIIGSFRYPGNVKKYIKQIRDEGFSPFVLRNEEGLFRVAVFSYDDEMRARDKVHAIWKAFPQHNDTWLLIKEE
ncbi:MAG TPA: SPOR domain-containing protein [Bacteroidetes bacterium]|nr:SPOR domain-containing protein [Bacteroidota bacterium]